MSDTTAEFDKEYDTLLTDRVRLRFGCDIDYGDVTRFLIQLEYRTPTGWSPIVRSDHNPTGVYGHDVESEGVHMDLYCEGDQIEQRQIGPPMSANDGLTCAEEHLAEEYERHVRRFEQWHNLNRSSDP